MRIKREENELFRKWALGHSGFVADGVADGGAYLASDPKVVFVMKEVNDPGGGDWDQREFVRKGGRPQTWNNITRWAIGIRELDKDIAWKDLEEITEQQRIDALKSICAMNLKKSPGGSAADNVKVSRIAEEDRGYLREQFSLYNAHLVICCGSATSEIFHSVLELDSRPDWKTTTRGVWFHEYLPKKYIKEYSHPQARVQSYLLYYGLVDAVREIFAAR
jgi:hypothetical protein